MANCRKDCIHYPVCDLAYRKTVINFDTMQEEYRIDLDSVEEHCQHFLPHPQKKVVYWISCSTGCSDQNFDYGFFFDKDEAETQANKWRNGDGNPLASQYAKYGRYYVNSSEAEILSDGRAIVDEHIFESDSFCEYKSTIYW